MRPPPRSVFESNYVFSNDYLKGVKNKGHDCTVNSEKNVSLREQLENEVKVERVSRAAEKLFRSLSSAARHVTCLRAPLSAGDNI